MKTLMMKMMMMRMMTTPLPRAQQPPWFPVPVAPGRSISAERVSISAERGSMSAERVSITKDTAGSQQKAAAEGNSRKQQPRNSYKPYSYSSK